MSQQREAKFSSGDGVWQTSRGNASSQPKQDISIATARHVILRTQTPHRFDCHMFISTIVIDSTIMYKAFDYLVFSGA
jgi:hypothetical protein